MAKRSKLDWESIEKAYRAGVLSLRQIARDHGCNDKAIRDRAKKYGWERDLTEKVKNKVRNKLVRNSLRTDSKPLDKNTEKDIIEQAADIQVSVIQTHCVFIKKGLGVVDLLLTKLTEAAEDKEGKVSLQAQSSISVNLANSLKTLTALQRQAYNIEGAAETTDEIDKIQIEAVFPNGNT